MAEQNPTPKRRGIATARGTQRLKFSHELAKNNGLFIGHLDSVTVSKVNISEASTGMPSFNGCEIPRLNLVFASNEPEVEKRHYVALTFTAVESTVDTIPGGKSDWQVSRIFDYMKHLLDVYVTKGRALTAEEEDALSLSFEDFDEQGVYVPVAVEKVIAAYNSLFDNFAAIMNTAKDGKPAYLTNDGKFIPVWFKIIRHIKNKKGWSNVANGELAFPTFVGEGVVEIWKQNVMPSLRLDTIKESIIPREDNKDAKAPTVPGIGGMPAAGGVAIDPMMQGIQGLATEAGAENPF